MQHHAALQGHQHGRIVTLAHFDARGQQALVDQQAKKLQPDSGFLARWRVEREGLCRYGIGTDVNREGSIVTCLMRWRFQV